MTPSELQAENERLRAELEEAKAETSACLKFLECELGWEDFRAEMLYASKPEARSTSERNTEKLLAFLKEKGHGLRFLAKYDEARAQVARLAEALRPFVQSSWKSNKEANLGQQITTLTRGCRLEGWLKDSVRLHLAIGSTCQSSLSRWPWFLLEDLCSLW